MIYKNPRWLCSVAGSSLDEPGGNTQIGYFHAREENKLNLVKEFSGFNRRDTSDLKKFSFVIRIEYVVIRKENKQLFIMPHHKTVFIILSRSDLLFKLLKRPIFAMCLLLVGLYWAP